MKGYFDGTVALVTGAGSATWLTPLSARPCSLLALLRCFSLLAFIMQDVMYHIFVKHREKRGAEQ
jgi:hypothetical protein